MKKKIVLAEDDQDPQLMLTLILRNAGYEVTNLVGGTPIVNNQCVVPDLFIADIKMAVIDGLALCKYLKINKCTKNVPIILISGCDEYRTRALAVGADCFLSKPIVIDELLEVVEQLIARSQLFVTTG